MFFLNSLCIKTWLALANSFLCLRRSNNISRNMYVPKTLERVIQKASGQFLRHLARKNCQYVALDDPTLLAFVREEPKLFKETTRNNSKQQR